MVKTDYRVYKKSAQPVTWEADAVYYIKNGSAVDCYVTDDVGTPYPVSNAGALRIINRLSEFDDETSRIAARENLGLQNIDGGEFF